MIIEVCVCVCLPVCVCFVGLVHSQFNSPGSPDWGGGLWWLENIHKHKILCSLFIQRSTETVQA